MLAGQRHKYCNISNILVGKDFLSVVILICFPIFFSEEEEDDEDEFTDGDEDDDDVDCCDEDCEEEEEDDNDEHLDIEHGGRMLKGRNSEVEPVILRGERDLHSMEWDNNL